MVSAHLIKQESELPKLSNDARSGIRLRALNKAAYYSYREMIIWPFAPRPPCPPWEPAEVGPLLPGSM